MSSTIRNADEKINMDQLIHKKVALASLCSFGTGGAADYLAIPTNLNELRISLHWAKSRQLPITMLGRGTNVLIADDGIEGLVILTTRLDSHHARGCIFCSEGGLSLDTAINIAIENSLSGLEPLGGLPGTVAGAVYGNAGANGRYIGELIEWVEYLDPAGNLLRYHNKEGGFSYKKSPFTNSDAIIYEVAFRLIPNKNSSKARLIKEQSRTERLEKGQFDLPSAGSVFKNPENISAGKLIEEAGLKGVMQNGAMVSPQHANFIVNSSRRATSQDIFDLSTLMQKRVKELFGITLEREIILLGRWNR
ncbi:MAG: UDP-N-acetylmuramate dehydrogenase [Sphaerochaetaceae bacterium]|nr:UDP-N-acetylmuramate dehydrogenase [Sphaerochaetaceae bacterium]MDD4220193.1 UDP-N-acetylmuramate dehydrogenase [Sphaerochaetaceae bacterium]MDY0372197.1 UDP-N-acetylmuramate dehydrogenase [Sphaerochaetaceae bacterium]